jgi:hypothetical protein
MRALHFDHIDQLRDPEALSRLTGPVVAVERLVMPTVGFSGSTHERFELRLASGDRLPLVLKHTRLSHDWVTKRTADDVGREAALLGERKLDRVWEVFSCPYVAYAAERGALGLLMHDLTEYLMPDVREPLAPEQEAALLGRIARLHARFWEDGGLDLPWLARPEIYGTAMSVRFLDPGADRPPAEMFDRVSTGWDLALSRLAPAAARLMTAAPAPLVERCRDLPRTLLHGDVKVANFAAIPGGRIAAFDWSLIGAGPPTIEVGWYWAVNATRLTCSKHEFAQRYRERLESARGTSLPEDLWRRLLDVAVLTGAYMLLWSKAFAVEAGTPGAGAEWEWWATEVERVAQDA